MKKTLILAGGGHAHMESLANLDQFVKKGFDVKVIGPSAHHYYSGMGPGMLGKTYTPENVRFATQHLVEKKGGTFILGKIIRIDAEARTVILESGKSVVYDVLSCNLGSHVPTSMIKGDFENIYMVRGQDRIFFIATDDTHNFSSIDNGFVKNSISALRCISRNFTYEKVRCISSIFATPCQFYKIW